MYAIIDKCDVALTRALFSVYRNTDIAAAFALDEINTAAREARQ